MSNRQIAAAVAVAAAAAVLSNQQPQRQWSCGQLLLLCFSKGASCSHTEQQATAAIVTALETAAAAATARPLHGQVAELLLQRHHLATCARMATG